VHVFKPKRKKGAKRWTSQFWSGRYKLPGDATWTTVPLRVRQKDVAERKLAEIVNREERRRQGMLVDEVEAGAAARPLSEHLDDFERDLKARGRAKDYVRKVVPRCRLLVRECGWNRVGDISADRFVAWRFSAGHGPRTANHYLEAFVCFLEWMIRCGRLQTNPLARVAKAETRGHERVVRRAYTLEELNRLLAVAGPRVPIYLGAALTGLRHKELGQLRCGDVEVGGPTPRLRLPASIQKTREYRSLPLAPQVAEAWAPLVAGRPAEARLFAGGMPSHHTLRRDLEKARIARKDGRGRTVDFHSFRKTFTTLLQVAGVDRRVIMEVARHKDSRLTDLVYTDAERLDLRSAVDGLPALGQQGGGANAQENAHEDSHAGVPEGPERSRTGTSDRAPRNGKKRENTGEKRRFQGEDSPSNGRSQKWSRGESNPRPGTVSTAPLRV